jgi:hypothetical protein
MGKHVQTSGIWGSALGDQEKSQQKRRVQAEHFVGCIWVSFRPSYA